MANAHRSNVLVTSCLQRPVDPRTRAPLASYERDKGTLNAATAHADERDDYREKEDQVACGDACNEKGARGTRVDPRGERVDPRGIVFSNEEYYSKLEELKKAHLRTMAELESMYHRKLQLHQQPRVASFAAVRRSPTLCQPLTDEDEKINAKSGMVGGGSRRLRKSRSAAELRRGSGDDADASGSDVEKGLPFSPKRFIKNMWADFKLSPRTRRLSTSLPGERDGFRPRRRTARLGAGVAAPGVTVPEPFRMTLREAERRRRRGIKTRAEVELENAELRRQLDEMSECRNKFRASPAPAHVHLPLYEERRRREPGRDVRQERRLKTEPFSFLERERLKKERRQRPPGQPETPKPFKAKPVPGWAYASAATKDHELYRSIKKQMRAQETLRSASAPPSALGKRLAERKTSDERPQTFSHRPRINRDVPDFDAAFKRFQKRVDETKEVKPATACEPFRLTTARVPSRRQRVPAQAPAEKAKERGGPPALGPPALDRPAVGRSGTPASSLCSSMSASLELLPAKDTDATKKRHEAVRQALERRRRAEQEEARRTQRQKERQTKLQKLVQKRASANDPHLPLTHTGGDKLQEFRKRDRQRRREYQQELKEMQERVKGRPLLLEQVAQKNAKQAAHKRFADTLRRVHLSEDFLGRKAAAPRRTHADVTSEASESEDAAPSPVHYRKVFRDGRDQEESDEASRDGSEGAGHYSDRHDRDDGESDAEEAEDGKRDDEDEAELA